MGFVSADVFELLSNLLSEKVFSLSYKLESIDCCSEEEPELDEIDFVELVIIGFKLVVTLVLFELVEIEDI